MLHVVADLAFVRMRLSLWLKVAERMASALSKGA